jgi:hypothetical protein
MSKKREREHEEAEVESELDAAQQETADRELLEACCNATVVEVGAALRKGASVNAVWSRRGLTGLMEACARKPEAAVVPIVELLLRKKFSVSLCDADDRNALHYACCFSSGEVVRLLLQADKKAASRRSTGGVTCLMRCTGNECVEESLKIAAMLLDSGCCDVNARSDKGKTALMWAASNSQAQVVSLLIARGADVHARDEEQNTALHYAAKSDVHARQVVPVLCLAGVDATLPNARGRTAVATAMGRSKAVVDALAPFLPPHFNQSGPVANSCDPVGSLACAIEFGTSASQRRFARSVARGKLSWAEHWARLRGGSPLLLNSSTHDEFRALLQSNSRELWKWASSEPQMQQHPITGDTVFHLLCRTEALTVEQKLALLADLRLHYRNPLVPNYRNELCVQLAREPELKKALQEYACWQPHRLAMEWFGPLFQRRARALLLVCYRLKAKHPKLLAGLNRDIRHLLVKYASMVEYIYVPFER